MLRKLLALSLAVGLSILGTSCVSNSEYKQLRASYDSVQMLNVAYQDQAYETDSLVASIIMGFQELSHVESMININTLKGELPLKEQRRIKEHIHLLGDKLNQSNNAIEQLIQRVETSEQASMRMRGTISILREQLSKQQERVGTIAEETVRKIKQFDQLDTALNRLRAEAKRMQSFNLEEQLRLKLIEDSLNTVYYALGTKGDFREMRLINSDDRVSVDHAELSYLTKSDKRELRELSMQSKTARLLSIHPKQSYRMRPDSKGYLTLEILEPKIFWEYTHIMLAEVDF